MTIIIKSWEYEPSDVIFKVFRYDESREVWWMSGWNHKLSEAIKRCIIGSSVKRLQVSTIFKKQKPFGKTSEINFSRVKERFPEYFI